MTPIDPRELLSDAARHLRNLPERTEGADIEMAARLEAAVASLPTGGGDGRHRLKISLDAGSVVSELICPESGCEPVDEEGPPGPCWLRTWAENEDLAANYMHDLETLGTFEIEATFDGDQPDIRIIAPASSPAGDETREFGRLAYELQAIAEGHQKPQPILDADDLAISVMQWAQGWLLTLAELGIAPLSADTEEARG